MRYRHSAKLALLTALFAFFMMIWRSYTRLTHSSLSFLTPEIIPSGQPFSLILLIQTFMTSRYIAALQGLLTLILALTLLLRKAAGPKTIFMALTLLILLGAQILLGQFTQMTPLTPLMKACHLFIEVIIFTLLWWTYLDLHWRYTFFIPPTPRATVLSGLLLLALLLIISQIILGGIQQAGFLNLNLQAAYLPTTLIKVPLLHRLGAAVIGIYFLGLFLFLLKEQAFWQINLGLLFLGALQFLLSVLNIAWLTPLWVALAYQVTAMLILLILITALVKISCTSRRSRYGNWLA